MLKHIPNILTIIRFLLIPIIIFYVFTGNYILAFVFFSISGLTDIADGFIARKFNLISNFGKLMDPLADKLTQIATLTSLVLTNIIPIWILLIVLLKEFIMICGASFLYGKDVVVYSKWYGKLSTVLFYVAIVCSFVIKYWNSIAQNPANSVSSLPQFDLWIYYLAIIATIASLVMYYITFYKQGYLKKENLKIENKE